MKKIIFISIFLVVLFNIMKCYADFSTDDYLWLELGNAIEDSQGVVTQPIFVCYGQFPNKNTDIKELNEFRFFYTFGEKDAKGINIFYEPKVEIINGKYFVKISSKRPIWCSVFALGKKFKEFKYNYSAKTSFFFFNNVKNGSDNNKDKTVPNNEVDEIFRINLYREKLKEFLTYNRLLGFPIRFELAFNKRPFRNNNVYVTEENGHAYYLRTDKSGEFVYIPRDEKMTRPPIKEKYRHFVVDSEQKFGDAIFIATYSALLRIEYFQRNIYFLLGITIFFASLIIFWVFFKRLTKNTVYENS